MPLLCELFISSCRGVEVEWVPPAHRGVAESLPLLERLYSTFKQPPSFVHIILLLGTGTYLVRWMALSTCWAISVTFLIQLNAQSFYSKTNKRVSHGIIGLFNSLWFFRCLPQTIQLTLLMYDFNILCVSVRFAKFLFFSTTTAVPFKVSLDKQRVWSGLFP